MNKYISCDLIENGLDLNVTSINFCCRSSAEGGGFKAIIPDYHGEMINWDEFFKIKNSYKDKLKNGEMIPECINCIYLYENDWDKDNYVANINLNCWSICNANCIYCGLQEFINDNPGFNHYDVLPIFQDMIDKNILKPNGVITFAGGEPTIIPEFEDVINLLLDFKVQCISILTNGTKYSKAIERGLREERLNIVVSIDSGTKEMYKKIKRVDYFDKVWENLKNYIKVQSDGAYIRTKYIVIPGINDNKNEIDLWLKKNHECGVKTVCADIELEWYAKNCENIPIEIYNLLNYMIEQSEKYNLNFEPRDRAVLVIKKFGNDHHVKFRGTEI